MGASTPATLAVAGITPLSIRAKGHGNRQMCRTNAAGFPIWHRARVKQYHGCRTGDIVQSTIRRGKYAGTHFDRVTIRRRRPVEIKGRDVHPKYCHVLQRADGYEYAVGITDR